MDLRLAIKYNKNCFNQHTHAIDTGGQQCGRIKNGYETEILLETQ
jgi:hypothetical protein